MKTKDEEIEDFRAWLEDLDYNQQADLDDIPTMIDGLPFFTYKWTVQELCSAIRDR